MLLSADIPIKTNPELRASITDPEIVTLSSYKLTLNGLAAHLPLPPSFPLLLQDLIIPLKLRYVSILTHYNWAPAAMYAFTRLGVADVLFKGPRKGMTVEDIAAQVKYIPWSCVQ